jgi:protein-S-isoprenylcysteine O-methyltransferase Ste14
MMVVKKFTTKAAAVFYALIMLEVLIMISPFAAYFYSFYRPVLQGLHKNPLTAWSTAFFLPHSVFTTSTSLEFLRWGLGRYLFAIGILGFLIFAIQLYSAKLRRRGLVKNFVYSYIRHPQYLFLIITGFGLLTYWPRVMILILYIGMILVYFYLAKFEESRVQSKHPEYLEYKKKTAMFIPGNPGKKLFNLLFGWIPNQKIAQTTAAVLTIVVLFGGAVGLRNLTIANTSTAQIPNNNLMAISVFPNSEQYLQDVVFRTLASDSVQQILTEEGKASFTAHILPIDYGMVGMFADVGRSHEEHSRFTLSRFMFVPAFMFPFLVPDLKDRIMGTESDQVKVLFSRIDKPGKKFVPMNEILDMSAKMTPVVIVDLNLATEEILNITVPPRGSFWGDIAMPIF